LLDEQYEIVGKLGGGGQSNIYLAVDTKLQKQVAVKELRTDLLPEDQREAAIKMFQREATFLAKLEHANVSSVLGFFVSEKRLYLVMEYIDGDNLQTIIDSESDPVPEERVIDWARQLCSAVSYLHSQNPPIIFRDLKPSNIMLSSDNVIKLIDFNVGRIFRIRKADTQPFGTSGYAPPEQYGQGHTDFRSDIYALGVTLYVLLTKYDPEKSTFNFPSLRSLNPVVSHTTEAVIHKAIQLRPSDRFQSVAEMWNMLAVSSLGLIEGHPAWPIWEKDIGQALAKTKRVKTQQLASVPHDLRLSAAQRYIALHSEQDISCSPDFKVFWLNRFADWHSLNKKWQEASAQFHRSGSQNSFRRALQEWAGLAQKDPVEEVVKELQNTINVKAVGAKIDGRRLSVYFWDVEPLFRDIKLTSVLPLAVLRGNGLSETDIEDLRSILLDEETKLSTRIVILLLFLEGRDLQNARQLLGTKMKKAYAYGTVLLTHDDLFQIATAKDPQRIFRSVVLSQVDLTKISPFVTGRPALA
jgi:serine/threonine-protein kinase